MRFEWDEKKNRINFEKHGVWFEEAQTLWAIARAIEFYDPEHSREGEDRFLRIGFSLRLNLLLVVFCEQDEGETIRIISVRLATLKERRQYEERL